jgi:hypothetical protein
MLDSTIPAEWFAQGDLDVQAAEILLARLYESEGQIVSEQQGVQG